MNARCVIVMVIACGASAGLARAQGTAVHASGLESRVSHMEDRLAGLTPERAREYFELGEEIAGEASDEGDRRLARQLYVLAFELSRRSAQPDSALAPSVCLALAAVAGSDEERRWLTALAETVAPDGAVVGGNAGAAAEARRMKASTASRDPAAFDLATMLGFVRIGEGRRAERLLARPGVQELLDRCDKLLLPGTGGASRVRKHVEDYPNCPQCHNKRYTKDATGIHLCPTCHGAPGGPFTGMELVGHLRTESVLLNGQQRSWSGQITSDFGSPLRELDPSELMATYGVDPTRPLWRNGRWTEDPRAVKASAAPVGDVKPTAGAGEPAAGGESSAPGPAAQKRSGP